MCLLHLLIKIETNRTNKVFRIKQAPRKVVILFLHMKMIGERFDRRFLTLQTNKRGLARVVSSLKTENGL